MGRTISLLRSLFVCILNKEGSVCLEISRVLSNQLTILLMREEPLLSRNIAVSVFLTANFN